MDDDDRIELVSILRAALELVDDAIAIAADSDSSTLEDKLLDAADILNDAWKQLPKSEESD